MIRLGESFFGRDTATVARALLGQRLVRLWAGQRLSGLVCETEAYRGADDQASHAYRRTQRSAIMYGPPGYAYVYIIYGRNYCLNVVTEAFGEPGAVLIRAMVPEEGLAVMETRRGASGSDKVAAVRLRHLTDGPGKVCQALGIDLALNGTELCSSQDLFFEAGRAVAEAAISATPRIGVRGDEETRRRLWRFVWHSA
jgi:DNA-3-methyladenine glycosylase